MKTDYPTGIKSTVYVLFLLVLVLVAVEGLTHLTYWLVSGEGFKFDKYNQEIGRLAVEYGAVAEAKSARTTQQTNYGVDEGVVEVNHPYLGFVRDPNQSFDTSYLGFPQLKDDPYEREPDTLNILIFGGSFAEGTSVYGEHVLVSVLSEHGIKANLITASMGGYKQPQQLITFVDLLSRGAKIDVAINLDGFNEVALPLAENLPKHVDPFYPRGWYFRAMGIESREEIRDIGRVYLLKDRKRWWASVFNGVLSYSISRTLVWRAYNRYLSRKIGEMQNKIRKSLPEHMGRFV